MGEDKNLEQNLNKSNDPLHISDVISRLLIKAEKMYSNRFDRFSIQIRDNELYVMGHEIVAGEADWEHIMWKVDEAIIYL
jgi:hypothetical protein